jgi:hypothetical protein
MLQLPTEAAGSKPDADPIFAAIRKRTQLFAEWQRLYDEMDDARIGAKAQHGRKPGTLIRWRNYTIGGREIDRRRESLLLEQTIDPRVIEQEYVDAKAQERAAYAAEKQWYRKSGLAAKRKQLDSAIKAETAYAKVLAKTAPITAAGAGAFLQYILDDDLSEDANYWHMLALKTIAAALLEMHVGS